MKRILFVILSLTMVSAMSFSAGGQESGTGEIAAAAAGPLGAYDPVLTVTTWRSLGGRQYVEGETWDDNIWTNFIADKLGIEFEYTWTAPSSEFDNKVNIAIAAGDLPEMLNSLAYDTYTNLAAAGKLAPLEDVALKTDLPTRSYTLDYPGGFFKDSFDFSDGLNRKIYGVNGKLYGFGPTPSPYDAKLLWVRDDWMAAVGGPEPTSMENFIELAYKLANSDPDGDGKKNTWGFGMHQNFFGGGMPMEAMFHGYGAYPEMWVEKNGKLVWGSVTDEVKAVLAQLAKFQADGVIDPEWPVLGVWSENPDQLVKDEVGMAFTQFWFGDWQTRNIMVNHPYTATWSTYPIPAVGGGPAEHGVRLAGQRASSMNADYANPEVLAKILLLRAQPRDPAEDGSDPFHTILLPDGGSVRTFFYFNDFFQTFGKPGLNESYQKLVTEALDTNDTAKLDGEGMGYYNDSKNYLDKVDVEGYGRYSTFGPTGGLAMENTIFENGWNKFDKFYASNTKSMNKYLGDLKSRRLELWARIISGDLPVDDGFAEWVEYWNRNGGADITQEVNEWYNTTK